MRLWHIARAAAELFQPWKQSVEVGAVVSFANPTFKAKLGQKYLKFYI